MTKMLGKFDVEGRPMDADIEMVLKHFDEDKDSLIIEVGANQECLAQILTDHGYKVLGVDLQEYSEGIPINYHRIKGDFCVLASQNAFSKVDCVISTSALEHFGLGTYPQCPGKLETIEDYDAQAMTHIYNILKPGGTAYITVPYGKNFKVDGMHWRAYDKKELYERYIKNFLLEKKIFFKSAGCDVPDVDGIVEEAEADKYEVGNPHLTSFLKLRKPS